MLHPEIRPSKFGGCSRGTLRARAVDKFHMCTTFRVDLAVPPIATMHTDHEQHMQYRRKGHGERRGGSSLESRFVSDEKLATAEEAAVSSVLWHHDCWDGGCGHAQALRGHAVAMIQVPTGGKQ
jgi:hypothetical protein